MATVEWSGEAVCSAARLTGRPGSPCGSRPACRRGRRSARSWSRAAQRGADRQTGGSTRWSARGGSRLRERYSRLEPASVHPTSARIALPPICFGYVAKSLMWRPPVFFREIPRDFATEGHITSRSPATETGLAVHHLRDGVLAVFDRLAVVGAFRRASSVMTASVSDGRPIQAAMFVMWRREQRKHCFSPRRETAKTT